MRTLIVHASCATANGCDDTSTGFDLPQWALIVIAAIALAAVVAVIARFARRGR